MTPGPARDQVETAVAELVRQALERRERIQVPGLGTFEVRHEHSAIRSRDDGDLVLMRPRDEIVFTPDR